MYEVMIQFAKVTFYIGKEKNSTIAYCSKINFKHNFSQTAMWLNKLKLIKKYITFFCIFSDID